MKVETSSCSGRKLLTDVLGAKEGTCRKEWVPEVFL